MDASTNEETSRIYVGDNGNSTRKQMIGQEGHDTANGSLDMFQENPTSGALAKEQAYDGHVEESSSFEMVSGAVDFTKTSLSLEVSVAGQESDLHDERKKDLTSGTKTENISKFLSEAPTGMKTCEVELKEKPNEETTTVRSSREANVLEKPKPGHGLNDINQTFWAPSFGNSFAETSEEHIQEFYHAVVEADMTSIRMMVEDRGLNINHIFTDSCIQSWHRGQGPIHIITRKGKVVLIKAIVELGALVDLRNKTGDTALHIACKYGFEDCVLFLLKCDSALKDAQNNQGLTPLVKAVFRFENSYRYEHAFRFSYMKAICHLLENKVNVNLSPASGITPLHIAAGKGDAELLRLLVDGGAEVNAICSKGFSPLLTALCRTRIHTASIKLLLDSGADISVCTVAGRSALHLAVSKSDDRTVQHLLDAGADPNHQDNYGKTPLWIAVHENNIKIVPMLINFGGNVNQITLPSKECLLSMAIQKQFEKMATLLINHGADVNSKSAFSATPLHRAVEVHSVPIVKQLMFQNCSREIVSNATHSLCPQTPLQIALEKGHLEMIQILMKAGCCVKNVWLKQSNLPLCLTTQPAILDWVLNYHYNPCPLTHISRLACREILGEPIQAKVQQLIDDHLVPVRLADYILMYDILS